MTETQQNDTKLSGKNDWKFHIDYFLSGLLLIAGILLMIWTKWFWGIVLILMAVFLFIESKYQFITKPRSMAFQDNTEIDYLQEEIRGNMEHKSMENS